MTFKNDPKDRKRRFLRGLNTLLGSDYFELENKDIPIKEAISVPIYEIRRRLVSTYCLEFTNVELKDLIESRITMGEFTEKYCPVVYGDRGNVDLNSLVNSSMKEGAIDCRELDNAPKFGLNGKEWCDVAEGPCSCGAWHH